MMTDAFHYEPYPSALKKPLEAIKENVKLSIINQ